MKNLFLFLLLSFAVYELHAQDDIILKHDGTEIRAQVEEITGSEVKYRMPDRSVIYAIGKQDVFMIKYKNGTKDMFGTESRTENEQSSGVQSYAAAYPYPPVSRNYSHGDYFDEDGVRGIVFYVSDGGQHGLIVSLRSSSKYWLKFYGHDQPLNFTVNATDSDDGWNNRMKIEDCINKTGLTYDNFPAFKWCRDLGAGWYLPARNELMLLFMCFNGGQDYGSNFAAQRHFNSLLQKAGGEKLSTSHYRSSTEHNVEWTHGLNLSGWENDINLVAKRGYGLLRAVHKF